MAPVAALQNSDLKDREAWLDQVQAKGRVKGFRARFRTRWSEEFTISPSGTLARYRGSEVILGVGTIVPTA